MCLTDAVNVKLYSECESVEVISQRGPRHAGVAVRKCANCAADLQAPPMPPTPLKQKFAEFVHDVIHNFNRTDSGFNFVANC